VFPIVGCGFINRLSEQLASSSAVQRVTVRRLRVQVLTDPCSTRRARVQVLLRGQAPPAAVAARVAITVAMMLAISPPCGD
jgi:hypothetical protein